ncbi:MAG: hypothetical protein ACRDN9_12960 [Streptosporangiaceae bacterium]
MFALPPSAVLTSWGNAWLTGDVGLDEVADTVEYHAGPQVVVGLPGEGAETPLRQALALLRTRGISELRLALPVPGDPLGLMGPAALNAAAIEAGEAALVALSSGPLGLVPEEDRRGSSYVGIRWAAHPATGGRPDVPSLAEAEQTLIVTIRESTETLSRLDVAKWRPDVTETLAQLREPPGVAGSGLAPSYPPRAHRVVEMARRIGVVAALALEDEGGAVTASEMADRRATLRDLDRVVRRAKVAALNCVADHLA